MSETFTKLFSSLTDSTIWAEDNDTRILWITMLAMADKNGYVGAAIPGLAARARISIEATERGLAKFMAPDPYSRSKDNDGRRLEIADRGWRLLNYQRYRDMRDEESRREYERLRKREQRNRAKSHDVPNCPDCPQLSPDVVDSPAMSAQAEAEADPERSGSDSSEPPGQVAPEPTVPPVMVFPTSGKVKTWGMPEALRQTLQDAFPGVEIVSECRRALAWCTANQAKRKTARGMPAFLTRWVSSAQDKGNAMPRQSPGRFDRPRTRPDQPSAPTPDPHQPSRDKRCFTHMENPKWTAKAPAEGCPDCREQVARAGTRTMTEDETLQPPDWMGVAKGGET